ncbi:MAG: hypothetical protein WBA13_13060 [Microcoleaceae cyanobacterium]
MSENTVRIVTYEAVIPSPKSDDSDGRRSPDVMIPAGVPTFPSENSSKSTDEVITGFKVQEVPKEALKAGMKQLMDVVEELMTQMDRPTDTSAIKLDEVELSVVVNGQGQFSLWGTGVTAGSTGAIKLKFKRQDLK